MTLEQLNYINKVLTVDLKSFVLLELEKIISEDYIQKQIANKINIS